jgi:hypothetical protein
MTAKGTVVFQVVDFKHMRDQEKARANNVTTLDVFLFIDTFYSTTHILASLF